MCQLINITLPEDTLRLIDRVARKGDRSRFIIVQHTFLRKLAGEKGVQYAKEASGHKSDRYIWRYVKPSQQSLAEAIDELE